MDSYSVLFFVEKTMNCGRNSILKLKSFEIFDSLFVVGQKAGSISTIYDSMVIA
jgi:hypothetical protein